MTLTWTGYARTQLLLSWRVFWRNRRSTFIGFLLPVLLTVAVAAPVRGHELDGVPAGAYVTIGFTGFALVTSFINLLNGLVSRRDDLVLKRLRGTEVPPSAVLAGQFGAAGAVVLVQSVLLGALAVGWFDAPLPADPPLFLLTLAAGFALFALLAAALSGLTPSAEAAPLVAMPVLLLSMFAGGVASPLTGLPDWLQAPAHALPLSPVVETLRTAWFGHPLGTEAWTDLALLAAWTAGSALLTRRLFRWEPRHA